MQRSKAWAGLLGIVFLAFALISYFVGARFYFLINLLAGVFSLVLWATSTRESFGSIVGRRSARYGANAVLYSIGFIALLAAINYICAVHHRRFDLTAENVFSLSPQSEKIVANLKQPLKFYGFVAGGRNDAARALYESYSYASPKITYELVDPEVHPEMADRYKVSVMNTTHIQYGGEGTNVTDLTEQAITNGIIKITSGGSKVACFVAGHGEPELSDTQNGNGFGQVKNAVEGENYQVKSVVLASEPAVPSDCSVLIEAGPVRPLMPHEIDAISDYLKHGGRLLVMLQPPRPDQPNDEDALVAMLKDWGVEAGNDVVVDTVVRLFAGPALGLSPIVNSYPPNPITEGFQHRTVFPMTRSLIPAGNPPAGLTVSPIAVTSDTSWAETDLEGVFKRSQAKLTSQDRKGPIPVAVAVEAALKQLKWGDGDARLVIFGSTGLAENGHFENFFNRDLFMNSIDWLTGQTATMSIRPRELRSSRVNLTVDQFNRVFVASVLVLPELLLIIGIVVWRERRN